MLWQPIEDAFRTYFIKKLYILILGTVTFNICHGQRYEVWVNPSGHKYEFKGFYGYSGDSVLTIYSKSTLFTPSNDYNIRWDKIDYLNIRNKSKNEFWTLFGTATGLLATYLIFESAEKKSTELPWASLFYIPILTVGGGSLTGYLLTCAKISIPLNGKTSKEKSQTLRTRINK